MPIGHIPPRTDEQIHAEYLRFLQTGPDEICDWPNRLRYINEMNRMTGVHKHTFKELDLIDRAMKMAAEWKLEGCG